MRRSNNQDSLVCVPATSKAAFQQRGHLFVVADGMGAHAAGELASQMATSQIAQHYSRLAESLSNVEALYQSIARANRDIFARGQSNPEFHNMGTTACAAVVSPVGVLIGHVGDSRVYRLRNNSLDQMTFDHSLVWELQAGGQVTEAGAANIPKNVITRSLGPSEEVKIDIEGPLDVQVGDRFLLCSDGLTGPVSDPEIAVLMSCLDEDTASRVLVDLANLRGGPDNISVIIFSITQPVVAEGQRRTGPKNNSAATNLWRSFAAAGFVVAIVMGLAGQIPLAIVAAVLGVIAAVAAVSLPDQTSAAVRGGEALYSGGKAPYRQYPVHATAAMVHGLGQTIDQLCAAADDRGWRLDQDKIDQLRQKCRHEVDQSKWQSAIEFQSEAIIEMMNQLRRQNEGPAAAARGSTASPN